MKKILPVLVLILLFFSSCSDTGNVYYTGAGEETLKQVIKTKEEAAIWTQELEGERLTKNIRQIESVSPSVKLTPDVLKVSTIQNEPVYPRLKDFGLLDVSELPEDIYQIAKTFCDSISSDLYSVQDSFEAASIFSYVFFLDDLKKDFFKDGLPERSENDNRNVFDKYLIGKPFGADDELQIPIRFYKSSNYLDAVIFISTSTNKITQIKIDRVGKIGV